MRLWEYVDKEVRVVLKNGHIYEGEVCDYTSAPDNTPEIESIGIGHNEIYENEIAKIELI